VRTLGLELRAGRPVGLIRGGERSGLGGGVGVEAGDPSHLCGVESLAGVEALAHGQAGTMQPGDLGGVHGGYGPLRKLAGA
jgi:hypothetical protein